MQLNLSALRVILTYFYITFLFVARSFMLGSFDNRRKVTSLTRQPRSTQTQEILVSCKTFVPCVPL